MKLLSIPQVNFEEQFKNLVQTPGLCNFIVFDKMRLNILQSSQARSLVQEVDNAKISKNIMSIFSQLLRKLK